MKDITRFIDRTRYKRELEAELKRVKAEVAAMEAEIRAEFLGKNVSSITQDGYTVYLARDLALTVEGGTTALVAALKADGLEDMLTANTMKIRAWAKEKMHRDDLGEWTPDKSMLPEHVAAVVEVAEFHRLGCRKK